MDKKQALEEGIELWTILAQTGGSEKKDISGPWQDYMNHCPCCEYTEGFCGFCPIVWVSDGLRSGCCEPESPYNLWMKAETVKERKFFAQQVADLHEKALEVLTGQIVGTIL
jgi:hypothetical protein